MTGLAVDLVGVIASVAGVIAPILMTRRGVYPVFVYSDTRIQMPTVRDVTVTFEGQPLEHLSRTTVLLYNAGGREIRQEDAPGGTFPSLRFPEGVRLLDCRRLSDSSEEMGFETVKTGEREVRFRFRYMNPGHGGVAQVFYDTGDSSDGFPGEFRANLVGGPRETHAREFLCPVDVRRIWLSAVPFCVVAVIAAHFAWTRVGSLPPQLSVIRLAVLLLAGVSVGVEFAVARLHRLPRFAREAFTS